MAVKREIRVLGIDDASFDKHKDHKVKIIGVLYRGGHFMDGCMTTDVMLDGDDATESIAMMVNKSKFRKQIQYILLDGIAVAGFNVVDIRLLFAMTRIPVIIVTRHYPDFRKIKSVLKKLGMEKKIAVIEQTGEPVKHRKILFQSAGTDEDTVREVLDITTTHSYIPEPIRIAHLIGQGLALGESRGGA
jgi:uncharacterized protein